MKVYLAARYSQKDALAARAVELVANGIEVTSTWLTEPHAPQSQLVDITEEQRRQYAMLDVQDIARADLMVFFSVDETTPTLRGGRHVEFGIAIALGLPILVVGPKENIFHYLYDVRNVETFSQALEILKTYDDSKPLTAQGA